MNSQELRAPLSESHGHIGCKNGQEFFAAHECVWRADLANPVAADGFRPARFEATVTAWNALGHKLFGLPQVGG